jgi:hypothetical protein
VSILSGVTVGSSLSRNLCRREMSPIDRRVWPPILRARSAMASVIANMPMEILRLQVKTKSVSQQLAQSL